ncbi:hypothetical protein [Lutibaculum baratangense]|uniref:Uncharacterized protein n=1 Tax=Lutibaculum baratangense AMV1 TaxID=631454 RepID=V4R3B4_9HYPH|nr:hypothetical protein [Lutibaculum baratangense]ESR26402.1 hypothetical protein N177_0902 [Lutibaculum baratangense AMV1]
MPVEPLGRCESVASVIHAVDPDAFGVRAFLFMEEEGGEAFVREILLGGAGMSTGAVEYLWTP